MVGAALFGAGILLLVFMLYRVFRRIGYRDTGDPRHPPPRSLGLLILAPALVLIVGSQGFFWLASQLEYFRPMREDGFVGWIRIERRPDPVRSLAVRYIPMAGDSMGITSSSYLTGDSWRLSGEVLNFKFANDYLQLPQRMFKLTRINSRYVRRAPPGISGTMFGEFNPEGGPSDAASIFRDSRIWSWFVSADSFGTDYLTTEKIDEFAVRVRPDRSVVLVPRDKAEPSITSSIEEPAAESSLFEALGDSGSLKLSGDSASDEEMAGKDSL